MSKIFSFSVVMGGTPQGKVTCDDLSGPMPPKGQKEWFGIKYVALQKNIL